MKPRRVAVPAAILLLLAACGPDDNPDGNPGSDGEDTATTSDLYN